MPEPSSKNSSYADVSEMFRRLKLLDEGSLEFRRQREAIVERCLPSSFSPSRSRR
jgi:RNA polymerase sigma-B factor